MEVYKPEHFQLYELVPMQVFVTVPEHKLWQCFDPNLLWTADQLRGIYGTANINTWKWGGNTQYRGWRPQVPPPGQKWAEWTMHAWFKALDMVFKNVPAHKIREDIKANKWPVAFQYIKGLEDNISWLHIDTRNSKELLIFSP